MRIRLVNTSRPPDIRIATVVFFSQVFHGRGGVFDVTVLPPAGIMADVETQHHETASVKTC